MSATNGGSRSNEKALPPLLIPTAKRPATTLAILYIRLLLLDAQPDILRKVWNFVALKEALVLLRAQFNNKCNDEKKCLGKTRIYRPFFRINMEVYGFNRCDPLSGPCTHSKPQLPTLVWEKAVVPEVHTHYHLCSSKPSLQQSLAILIPPNVHRNK